VGVDHGDVGLARVGHLADEAVVEQAAERVEVAAAVDLPALDLLGRDVVDRPDHVARLRDLGAVALQALRESEICQKCAAALDQDVRRLDVAVDQPERVGGVERRGDLAARVDRPVGPQAALLAQHGGEVRALDVLHREVEQPVDLAGVVDRDDVRVLERRGDPRLALEALAEALRLGVFRGDDLDRGAAPEVQVLGPVDDAHAAAPEAGLDPVAGDGLTDARVSGGVRHHHRV
jgi:hypothetical protein